MEMGSAGVWPTLTSQFPGCASDEHPKRDIAPPETASASTPTLSRVGDGSGIPAGFFVLWVLALLVGIGTFIWRISMARSMARRSGMDVNEATAMSVLTDDGVEATYLASNLRPAATASAPPPVPRSAAERLQELQQLRDRGLVTDEEYAARRAAIIDSV